MKMQRPTFPIFSYSAEENRELQLLLAATSDRENSDSAGGRGKSEKGLGF